MKIWQAFLIGVVGLGGGGLWLVATSSDAHATCGYCSGQTCVRSGVDTTCKDGVDPDGKHWCIQSSGCAEI